MKCDQLYFSRHAIERMFQRAISPIAVRRILETGECISSYPQDKPTPSFLYLGFADGEPIHIVVGQEEGSAACHVITVYRPDSVSWNDDFRTRRKQ